jgi:hypothetical protein
VIPARVATTVQTADSGGLEWSQRDARSGRATCARRDSATTMGTSGPKSGRSSARSVGSPVTLPPLCRGDRSRSHEPLAHAAPVRGKIPCLQLGRDVIPRPPGVLKLPAIRRGFLHPRSRSVVVRVADPARTARPTVGNAASVQGFPASLDMDLSKFLSRGFPSPTGPTRGVPVACLATRRRVPTTEMMAGACAANCGFPIERP